MNELVVMHLLGCFGVLLAFLFVYSTIGSVREARKAGSLGGLATRNETIYYFKELLWVLYSLEVNDFWLFLSDAVPAAAWLWF